MLRLSRAMIIAFLMADHARLGAEACGRWQRWLCGSSGSCSDVLRLVMEQLQMKRGVVDAGQIGPGGCAVIGHGVLRDPRAITIGPAQDGVSRIFVADAGTDSIKVFDSFTLATEYAGVRCPLGLALTSTGDLIVLQGSVTGESSCLVLLDGAGNFVQEIVKVPFEGPFTIDCDCSDRVTLLHRCARRLRILSLC